MIGGGEILNIQALVDQTVNISLGVSTLGIIARLATQRPREAQSCYFQPVQILKLTQKFVSGALVAIKLKLTNQTFKQRFVELNKNAIADNEIIVQ